MTTIQQYEEACDEIDKAEEAVFGILVGNMAARRHPEVRARLVIAAQALTDAHHAANSMTHPDKWGNPT